MKRFGLVSYAFLVGLVLTLQCAAFQPVPSKLSTQRSRKHVNDKPQISHDRFSYLSKRPETTALPATNPLLSAIASPLGSVAVLATVVLIHEAGHYLAARSLGVKVEEFSVGIGPKLLGFKAFGDEFNLRALPLGGYVRFPENYNATQVYELQEAAMKQQAQQQTEQENDGESSLLSGLMNVFTLGGYERKRREVENERLAQERDQTPWWRRTFASKEPQKKAVERPKSFEIEYYDDPDLLQNRPWFQRALVLSGGVVFNILLAFTIFFGEINIGSGLPQPVFEQGAVVTAIPRADAASKGILKPGDVIVSVNGSPLSTEASPNAVAAQRAISDFISKIRETPEGESLSLQVIRDKSQSPIQLNVKPKNYVDEFGNTGPQSIGAMLRPNFVATTKLQSDNIFEATRLAANSVTELTTETANGLLGFLASLFQGKSGPINQSVSGPIGLIRQGSDIVSSSDLTAVLTFAAALSVNLAVVNSLPLPALDGGQLVFVLAEAVTGRKIDQRLQEGITSVAILFLLFLTVGTTVGDLESLISRR